jgi:DnaJ family protein C protein 27
VRVNLWDLAGSPDYLEVRNEFYKDSQAALLAFDLTNRQSFESLSSWMAEAAKYGAPANMVRPHADTTVCQGVCLSPALSRL